MEFPIARHAARTHRRSKEIAAGALAASAAALAIVGNAVSQKSGIEVQSAAAMRKAAMHSDRQDAPGGPSMPTHHPAHSSAAQDQVTARSENGNAARSVDNNDHDAQESPADETSFEAWQRAQAATRERERDQTPTFRDRLSVDLSLDVTNAYFFRGLLQEKDDVILQPALEFGYRITNPNDVVDLDAVFGTWNSLHGKATGASTSDDLLEHWYESDIYAGIRIAHDSWSLTGLYYFYLSPSDAFDTVQELELALAYDDSALWNNEFALNPEVRIAFETSGAADGGRRGTYLQLGITPGMDWNIGNDRTIALSVPVTLGLSLNDYYEHPETGRGDSFGFLDLGVDASTELIPGTTLSGGVHYLFLGDSARAFNGGKKDELIGRIGVSLSF